MRSLLIHFKSYFLFYCWILTFFYSSLGNSQVTQPTLLTSFALLQNVTEQLVPETWNVKTLVPPGQTLHSYKPSAKDTLEIKQADIILLWGLGLDDNLKKIHERSKSKASLFVVTKGINAITTSRSHGKHIHDSKDPHMWQSLLSMIQVVHNIETALIQKYPLSKKQIQQKVKSYVTKLQRLHNDYKNKFSSLSAETKRIVTSHQAFDYLALEMGLEIHSVTGIDSEANPSARAIKNLIDLIREKNIHAIFFEAGTDSRLLKRISKEVHVPITGFLYSDNVAESPAPQSYYELIEHNLKTIVLSLKGNPHE